MAFAFRPLLAAAAVFVPTAAFAHFQQILPSADILPETGDRSVTLDLVFTHPFEGGPAMDMAPPVRFGVRTGGETADLTPALETRAAEGKRGYRAAYRFQTPGDAVVFVEPAPYWEPAERKFIIHYAKVVVDFASGDGWDAMVGLPVEIEPLVRPYGLWTGNLFRGVVRKGGQPVPFAEIEVEWVNDGSVTAPADPFVTQAIKADAAGTFAYAMPRAGWWGFAALVEADAPMTAPDGKPAPVELGGLIWVKAVDMK